MQEGLFLNLVSFNLEEFKGTSYFNKIKMVSMGLLKAPEALNQVLVAR